MSSACGATGASNTTVDLSSCTVTPVEVRTAVPHIICATGRDVPDAAYSRKRKRALRRVARNHGAAGGHTRAAAPSTKRRIRGTGRMTRVAKIKIAFAAASTMSLCEAIYIL